MNKKLNMNKKTIGGLMLGLTSILGNTATNAEANYTFLNEKVTSYGGTGTEIFNSVIETYDGNIAVAGRVLPNYRTNITEGAILAKYNKDTHDILWTDNFDGILGRPIEGDAYYDIIETEKNDDIIAVGYTFNNSRELINYYDSEGNYNDYATIYGVSDIKQINSIIEESTTGDYLVVGDVVTSSGIERAFISSLTLDGDGYEIYTTSNNASEKYKFNSVAQLENDIIIAAGSYEDSNSNRKGVILKCEMENVPTRRKGSRSAEVEIKTDAPVNDVKATSDGGFVVVGDGFMSKYTEDLSLVWTKTFEANKLNSVVVLDDGSYLVFGGYTGTKNLKGGGQDALIAKYDSEGNEIWLRNWGGNGAEYFTDGIYTSDGTIVAVGNSYSTNAGFTQGGAGDAIIYSVNVLSMEETITEIEEVITKAEDSANIEDIKNARNLVNQMPESSQKDLFQDRLNAIVPNLSLDRKNATANLDIYIKSENMLSLSLDTNSVTFEEYSGAEPMEKLGAVNLTINSSLPYNLNAYMPTEITGTNGNNKMDIDILNIRESNEGVYKQFENTDDKLILKENCQEGNNINHSIDLKLDGNDAHEADIYKTVIRFEAEQK